MTETIALITGANKGIGLQTARRLGADGITVLVGARNAERGEEAAGRLRQEGADARFVEIDVADEASVAKAAGWIESEFGRLDVLVNNAGIMIDDAAPSETSLQVLRTTFETNVFGMVAVTNAMLPLLRRSAAPRIVNLSSDLGSLGLMSDPSYAHYPFVLLAYNTSKTAVNALTLCYAKELAGTPAKVNAVNPGYCATDLNAHTGPRAAEEGAAEVVRLATLPDDGPTGGYFMDEPEPGTVVPW
ncbi:NAD(P)-dependent dehydrogenase, short-chain alcohol dehydrogenase family [Thermomonospora echinospora]|uniref:NAD(P)-dependent dehydrogenase, short-chain alcohol dehydrogenase family n=1 Tax=Thermomonospora echinospora TaxID=1992 RepID=A0A1H5XZH3_9ACTN|nr:SDR family oxidoreductase [Thermomonospora echinospora]SEG17022.1 NAD(P)-dependent dehydrogenase, short-chain alcohol dehydrogenase family [Thermomonospora echinospora]